MSRETTSGGAANRLLLGLILLSGLALRVLYLLPQPDIDRFEDEKYAFENVVGILEEGSLRPLRSYYPSPVFNLPPAALMAAGNALHRATGDPRFLTVDEEGVPQAAGFLLSRSLMAVYGTLAVFLAFLVGRRLFSPRVGLLAAAMLAFMPWMIYSSGNFKPDPLLVMTVLLALWASLRAVAERRFGPYMLAGVAIALAASAKLTGGLVALPLTVATVIGWRDLRGWARLAAAGAASMVAFAVLNPYWWAYFGFLAGLRRDYAMRADWNDWTRAEIPGRVLDLMLDPNAHGPLVGPLALAGLLALAVWACRRGTGSARRVELAMLLVFPPAYVASYTLQTAYFKPNNFLPVLAITSLAAAWALAAVWRWATERWSALAGRTVARVAVIASTLLVVPPGLGYVHATLTPSTEEMVRALLRNRLARSTGRYVVVEREARWGPSVRRKVRFKVAQLVVPRLGDLPPEELRLADAEIFAERRLRGPEAAFYRQRMERLDPAQVHVFRPRFPRIRGRALVVLMHRRIPFGRPHELPLAPCDTAPTCVEAGLPADMLPRERFSLELHLPVRLAPETGLPPPILVGGRPVELLEVGRVPPRVRTVTARLYLDDPEKTVIRFASEHASRRPVTAWLLRWAGGPRRAPATPAEPPRPESEG